MIRGYCENLHMFLKDKLGRKMWNIRKQSLKQSVIESILGVAEFQCRNLCRWILRNWSSIIDSDDTIFYHWSINYVASKFYPIKIMILYSQRINETHQCTLRWSFRLMSNMHGSRSDDFLNFESDETMLLYDQLYSSCLKENVPVAMTQWVQISFYFDFWATMNNRVRLVVPESPKYRS